MQNNRPLIVDLDGTLLRSDILLESAFAFIRRHPLRAPLLFFWLLSGKANLKRKLSESVTMDVTVLPYDDQVTALLEQEKAAGRRLVLATASHVTYAEAVARHLGYFERVFATDGNTNLSAAAKRDALLREYGEKGFDYLGNSRHDLEVWQAAQDAYLANPEPGVEKQARKNNNVIQVIKTAQPFWNRWIKQLRLHQWAKNALIFVPLLASHRVGEFNLVFTGLLAFLLFGLCSSSVYLLNDLLDLEDDRQHPRKRLRPLAAGDVPIKTVLLLSVVLLLISFGGSIWLMPTMFTVSLLCYYILTLAYSLALKRRMAIDVIVLAILYTMRIVAGTFAFGVILTFWMLAFSMFLFLSLALVKRYAELYDSQSKGNSEQAAGRAYYPSDLEMISSLGAATGYLSVMVLALYIQEQSTLVLYRYPQVIWLACPMLLYWITRVWMLAHRGSMHEDPVVFALRDLNSIFLGVVFTGVFWLAA